MLMKKKSLTSIVFNILTRWELFHFENTLLFLLFSLHNVEPVLFSLCLFVCFLKTFPLVFQNFTDLRQDAFNCLADKIAEVETMREGPETKCTRHLK